MGAIFIMALQQPEFFKIFYIRVVIQVRLMEELRHCPT